jgi:hypothetical protein
MMRFAVAFYTDVAKRGECPSSTADRIVIRSTIVALLGHSRPIKSNAGVCPPPPWKALCLTPAMANDVKNRIVFSGELVQETFGRIAF